MVVITILQYMIGFVIGCISIELIFMFARYLKHKRAKQYIEVILVW